MTDPQRIKVPKGYPRAGRMGWVVSGSKTNETVDVFVPACESRSAFKTHQSARITVNLADLK